jgi:histone acetyltransferase (RNA polymerase elongator complex component)
MNDKRFIIPIFISHFGCPHRCVFCDQSQIARPASTLPTPEEISEEIEQFLRLGARKRKRYQTIQLAFYGGSFTALPLPTQKELLCSAAPFLKAGRIHSLRLSTRPDSISSECLEILTAHKVATVELGVQSMDDEVLRISQRGYGQQEVIKAVGDLLEKNFEVGIQLMIGLPGDSAQRFTATVEAVIELRPHFVRLYPTLVIKGTVLERWLRQGRYHPLSLEEALARTKEALQQFRQARIPVIRVGLQPTPSLETPGTIVAGPYHPAFRQLVESALLYEQAASLLACSGIGEGSSPTFRISPQDISTFYGQRGHTMKRLRETFALHEITVKPDPQQKRGTIALCV